MSNQNLGSIACPQHWANQYIGLPWLAGARRPDAYDCWGLFLAVQRCHFARDLPEQAAEMGRRAEARYWEHFTADQMVAEYVKLYRELAGR